MATISEVFRIDMNNLTFQQSKGLWCRLLIDLGIHNPISSRVIRKKQLRVPMEYIIEFRGANLRSVHHGIPKTSFIKVEDLLIALQPDISNTYNYICSIIQLEAPRYSTNILGSNTVKAC